MKKRIALGEIRAGTAFTEDVYIDEQNLFLPKGVPAKQRDLDMLKRWGVTHVLTEGEAKAAAAPILPSAGKESSQAKIAKTFAGSPALFRKYSDLVERLQEVFDKIARGLPVEPKVVDLITQNLIQLVGEDRDAAISAVIGSGSTGDTPARAGVDIAILAVAMGMALRLPAYKQAYLSTGALLHDSGMLRIPESIVKKQSGLSDEEAQKIKAHPLLSYRIITKELLYPDDVGLIGLQHHERWNGEGYPRKTAGGEIDVLARVVSVVDAFEAMISVKPYRNSMIGYAAMKNLLSDNARRFDPEILRAFVKSMGIYPLGSLVLLNNAAIAKVVENHAEAPLRPKLRLVIDEFGNKAEAEGGELVELLQEKSLFIARALDPKELGGA